MNAHTYSIIIQLLVMIYNQVRADGTAEIQYRDGQIVEYRDGQIVEYRDGQIVEI